MSLDKTLAKHQLEPGELTYALKQDILTDLLEIIGETDIQVRGTTQNKDNTMYWTKGTKVDYELRQELRKKIKAYCGDDK
jgi:hypothetical protein